MIKKGEYYICIKDVYMYNDPKDIAYRRWNIYISDVDNSIRDEGGSAHYWYDVAEIKEHFVRVNFPTIIENSSNRVEHPSHYTWLKDLCGIEVIDITRHMNFNLGNVIKYTLRAGHKSEEGLSDKQKHIEDLKKALFYIKDEIKRLEEKEKKDGK